MRGRWKGIPWLCPPGERGTQRSQGHLPPLRGEEAHLCNKYWGWDLVLPHHCSLHGVTFPSRLNALEETPHNLQFLDSEVTLVLF